MKNFNTMMAVVGALTHTAISRLKKTMALVPKDYLKVCFSFEELVYCYKKREMNKIVVLDFRRVH